MGPCKNPIEFLIDGTLLAPANPNNIKQDTWIKFKYINDLSISGSGTLDGQGKQSWPLNDCHKNPNCPKLAMVTFLQLFHLLLHFEKMIIIYLKRISKCTCYFYTKTYMKFSSLFFFI